MGNYYGINFSDGSHIEHGIRDAWANHKYKARKWVNGAWQYIYDDYQSAKQQDRNLHGARQMALDSYAEAHNTISDDKYKFKVNRKTGKVTGDIYNRGSKVVGYNKKTGSTETMPSYSYSGRNFEKAYNNGKFDTWYTPSKHSKSVNNDYNFYSKLADSTYDYYEKELESYKKNKKGRFFKAVDTFLNKFGLSIF